MVSNCEAAPGVWGATFGFLGRGKMSSSASCCSCFARQPSPKLLAAMMKPLKPLP